MRYPVGRFGLFLLALVLLASTIPTAQQRAGHRPPRTVATEAPRAHGHLELPLDFVENRGQWETAAKFVARKGALAASFEIGGIRLHLGTEDATLGLLFEHASRGATLLGETRRDGVYNYIVGNDPARWRSDVPSYSSLLYRGIYDGVDMRVREAAGQIEYDLLLAPRSNLANVVMRADGATGLSLAADGSLLVETAHGSLRQTPPRTWQVDARGAQQPLASRFRLIDAHRYGFDVAGHDPSLPLVIDPGLDWATFLGGNGDESVREIEIARDGTGDIVLTGQTQSPDFPRTRGNLGPVGWTPYVARMSADGSRLVYSTFFGGSFNHSVQDLALDSASRPVVVGDTNSLDFPTTPGAYDRTPGDGFQGDYDAYVIKFDASGGGPIFGTYLGGAPNTGLDQAWNVVFNAEDAPIISGITTSAGFPTTAGAYDRTIAGQDLFISRLSPDGSRLAYSTFFGGDSHEDVYDMAIDPTGVLYLTGRVLKFDNQPQVMPTTPGAFDTTFNGGGSPGVDAYLVRFKPDGAGTADLKYATFIGGAQFSEAGTGIAIDPRTPSSVALAGWTRSGDYPTTPGALLRTHFIPVDTTMVTLARFDFPAAGGGSLVWSTLYGSPGNQVANDVVFDAAGNLIIAGATGTTNPPTTERAFDRIPGTGSYVGVPDGFVARISGDGSRNLYSTLIGGSDVDDTAQEIAYVGGTSVVIAGLTNSPDFPVTAGAFDTIYGADGLPSDRSAPGTLADDVFLARLTLDEPAGDTTAPPAPQLLGPASGSSYTAHVMGVTFDWTDVSDPSGIAAYHLQLSPNAAFDNSAATGALSWWEPWLPTSIAVKGFSISETGTWYWRVQALDRANNLGPWSAVRTISVASPTPPAAPVLVSPPNGGRYAPGNIIFDWNPAARAKYYEIQVDTSSSFSNANRLWVRGLTATRYTASLTTQGTRWWRVRGTNDGASAGPWSATRSVEIRTGAPAAPVPPPDNDGGTAPGPGGTATAVVGFSPEELPLSGGSSAQLTVRLNGLAPAGGAVVRLSSNDPDTVSVPPSVTVPAGASSADFTVSAAQVIRPRPVIVSAAYGSGQDQGIWLSPFAGTSAPDLYALTINGTMVSSGTGTQGTTSFIGGRTVQGTVAFSPGWTAPPSGVVVTLGSTNPDLARVPSQIVIPAGANSATFQVTTSVVSQVSRVSILAARGMTHRVVLELLPPASLTALALNPSTVEGPDPSTGTVTLGSPAPAGGVVVALSSHDTRWATVPASVTVPAGASSANFTVTTKQNTSGEGQWSIITATAGGIQRQQTINVMPRSSTAPGTLSSLTLSPSTVVGGNSSTGTVRLTSAAPTGGVVVSIFSNSSLATVPPSVTVPAGSSSATFNINTSPISGANQLVNIIVGTSNSSREALLTITPPAAPPSPTTLSALSLSPATVSGGNPSTGTVILTGAAPAGGFVVSLTSDNSAATVPSSVTVPAGATSANFSVSTSAASTTQSANISASAGGVSRTAVLTVNPAAQAVTLTVTASGRAGERVTSNPAGINVTVGSTGSASFATGTSVTLSVTNGRDAIWSGACSSGGNKTRTCSFTLNGNASVAANVQ